VNAAGTGTGIPLFVLATSEWIPEITQVLVIFLTTLGAGALSREDCCISYLTPPPASP